jgi:HlyD family secretion protein
MDRPVELPHVSRFRKRGLLITSAFAGLVVVALLVPWIRRWTSAERTVAASAVRMATVVRGDIERDVAATGKIVAASHSAVFSPAPGTE